MMTLLFSRRAVAAIFTLLVTCGSTARLSAAAALPTLWTERLSCVVTVEYVVETEVDRRPTPAWGTVIDANGTIILPGSSIDLRAATWQLKDFKVYLPGEATSTPGEYLGQDAFTGWHFVRATDAKTRARMKPVTAFTRQGEARGPELADFVWGIGLRGKDEDFAPYLLQSNLALVQSLPQRTGIAQREIATPGLPVFDRDGAFVGLAVPSFGQTYLQFSRGNRGSPIMLVNVEESSAFWLAEEVLPYLGRIPKNVSGRPLAWLGAHGLEPMDREVANFLNLGSQSGAVVSEVIDGSPAEKAGLKSRDIILALDGKALPPIRPNSYIVNYIEREIDRRKPGETIRMTVLRGTERVEVSAELGEQPKLRREADRKYFDRLGLTAREFVNADAVERRAKATEGGVIAHYVKPSSPVAVAGLRPEDWIREIDGQETKSFAVAVEKLAAIEKDEARPEFVMLVSRGGDTAVLRVKLK